MKAKFLNEYAHGLIVANEETALYLEKLNRNDGKSAKGVKRKATNDESGNEVDGDDESLENLIKFEFDDDDEDDEDEEKTTDKTNALLFIDYSIIKFNRIVNILKELYENEMVTISKPVLKLSANENNNNNNNENSSLSPSSSSDSSSHVIISQIPDKKSSKPNSLSPLNCSITNSKLANENEHAKISVLAESNSEAIVQTQNNSSNKILATPSTQNTTSNNNNCVNGSGNSMHSRNACKKLKCPKCNWHYKYHETLDIHMKEKHSTDLANTLTQQCIYCLENAQHPRLGRGEQYKCGYKPYRCDICDYSTTTKGNLSIHMQSDKHMNNIKDGTGNSTNITTDNKLTATNTSDLANGSTQQRPIINVTLTNSKANSISDSTLGKKFSYN